MKRLLVLTVILFSASGARADVHSFSFVDPVGDHTGNVDVIGLDFAFDDVTGAYTIGLMANAADPFAGAFRVNINLFNPDTGTTDPDPSFFSSTFNDYDLSVPVSTLTLTGTDAKLLSWDSGDRVAASDLSFGNPDGVSAFKSTVRNLPDVDNLDIIAYGDFAVIDAPPSVVPVPGAILLGALGTGLVGWLRRRRAL